ncbi:uncharacterized protein C8A04DRAFT_13182 [Dichotomopilus funicola]|uniref:DUF6594 domain-containing protein n=1 Tax=Dichotomopilus funicola TaxID=1934379 RepID=A0AAN6V093_9PEZI|nr:hypothetical protein C8A04DRAFT_13182 [Dichotomopilus funicola]
MDSPVNFSTLVATDGEPDWLDVAAGASAASAGNQGNQDPGSTHSSNAVPSLLPPTTTAAAAPAATKSTTLNPAPTAPTAADLNDLIQEKPWKYVGYQAYSNLLASEPDFFVARKMPSRRELSSWTRSRRPCIDTVNKFILQQTALLRYPAAPSWDITSLKNWHLSHDNEAIHQNEKTYLDYPDDLIPLGPRDKTPLRRGMDRFLFLRTLPFWRDDRSKTLSSSPGGGGGGRRRTRRITGDVEAQAGTGTGSLSKAADQLPDNALHPTMTFYSDKVMDHFVSAVTIFIGVLMLVVPIWILQALGNASYKLGVITAFVLTCLLLTSVAMTSRPLDALGVTAAYAAVLMVFLQVGSNK